jgi:NAD(P)-dependent dehydrogenase (short-subunit alcohol dehydrogenase family)
MEFDLRDRVAVITGGSRGIGLAIANVLAEHGARIVIASRSLEACEVVAADLTQRHGVDAVAVRCHVGSWDDCTDLLAASRQAFGTPNVLVNNAGMSPAYPSVDAVSEALFDKVIDVNLKGPFRLSALFATAMAEGAGGSIINVSSVAAVQPRAGELVYAAAKAGLNALSTGFAHAFGPKVRINTIMPGPILTDIAKAWDMEEFSEFARELIPLQRGGQADEVAGAALYLASDASSYTSGAVIKIDGGHAWAAA